MEKYIKISRIITAILVFVLLNIWFIFENDPQWMLAVIISVIVYFISYPSSIIVKFIINNGDRIKSKLLEILYYGIALPIIFFLLLCVVALLCAFVVGFSVPAESLNLGLAVLIAFTGIGIFTCVLVPYFQTLVILLLRNLLKTRKVRADFTMKS